MAKEGYMGKDMNIIYFCNQRIGILELEFAWLNSTLSIMLETAESW